MTTLGSRYSSHLVGAVATPIHCGTLNDGHAMGYDLFITRAETPNESKLDPISDADCKALLQYDPSLEVSPTDYYDRPTPDGRTERAPVMLWTAHPNRPPFMLLSLIHISEPTRLLSISYAVFCLK